MAQRHAAPRRLTRALLRATVACLVVPAVVAAGVLFVDPSPAVAAPAPVIPAPPSALPVALPQPLHPGSALGTIQLPPIPVIESVEVPTITYVTTYITVTT